MNGGSMNRLEEMQEQFESCLLYTSDAADD